MSHAGTLPGKLKIGNNEPWSEAIEFVDQSNTPIPIDGAVTIGLRLKWEQAGHALLIQDDEILLQGNVASWTVPIERMKTLAADTYLFEIAVGDGNDRQIRIRGEIDVLEGIVP